MITHYCLEVQPGQKMMIAQYEIESWPSALATYESVIMAGGYPGADIILTPGDAHAISVLFWPASEGLITDSLDITHYGMDIYSITLSGTGTNADPMIAYSEVSPNPVSGGGDIALYVEVSDDNSILPGLDDIFSVTVDASSLFGGPPDAMVWLGDVDTITAAWGMRIQP